MKKLLIALCLTPFFAVATETGESCSGIEDNAKRLACYDDIFVKKESKSDEPKVVESKWRYEQDKDDLRNATTYMAVLASNNTIDFGFPYNGSSMDLTLRKDPKYGNDVFFAVNGQLESYRMVGSDGGDNSMLFIENNKAMKAFVDKLKKSKKLIVEGNFYNYGKGQFTFDTQGLEWKHF